MVVKYGLKRDWNRIKAAEMKIPKICQRLHQSRSSKKWELTKSWVFSQFMKKFQNTETNGKYICKKSDRLAFHFKPINNVSGR